MTQHIGNKIRLLRELKGWSQEKMAEKMNISKGGYGKIERGECQINMRRLEQIANIFQIDILELINMGNSGMLWISGDNSSSGTINIGSEAIATENEKLKLIIEHQATLLQQKEDENQILKDLVASLKEQLAHSTK